MDWNVVVRGVPSWMYWLKELPEVCIQTNQVASPLPDLQYIREYVADGCRTESMVSLKTVKYSIGITLAILKCYKSAR